MQHRNVYRFAAAALVLGLAVASSPRDAMAQGDSASDSHTAHARLVAPLTLAENQELNFGNLIKNFSSGTQTVTMTPALSTIDIVSSDPSQLILFGGEDDGNLQAQGEPGEMVQVSADSSFELVKDGVASPTDQQKMTVDSLIFYIDEDSTGLVANGGTFAFPSGGIANLESGGRLTVSGDDETGSYTGSFNVTIAYQ
jgi:Domain of unknown function (DUF4402)